ncbi:cobalt ABC transporter ATP-binding protein [Streptococcus pneumoniae]|nr:cobalt ABC transporter ATP-binding protein [Streptococcus pneumoniae]
MKEAIIEWKDFSFRYETQQEPTLQGIDLTIYKGLDEQRIVGVNFISLFMQEVQ